ncbi:antibiotic biosynthesis monooxygenase [Glycomyces sp. TRM65418]|uniref:putative quinol monooxygenase n=1 Tax=Glycomyces sp. TRM65418 TaxID=2867006 RepID=UPI001CE6DBAA|nr:putative quinol monooxygenase [Glycomyces sp. TRM65418]MCC3763256.1 antibiotic biosynthesis monooxygenase [Glycomyces sp. TRM65418]QZD57257.1 antibiotic biosynthesis monooxygenase [Glycomyces sp. TRM65418]
MITVHAYVYAQPRHRDAYLQGLRALQAATRAHDPGCLRYEFWQSIDDPDAFVCVEQWTDRDALQAHLDAPHHAAADAALDAYRARPAEIQVFESTPISL